MRSSYSHTQTDKEYVEKLGADGKHMRQFRAFDLSIMAYA